MRDLRIASLVLCAALMASCDGTNSAIAPDTRPQFNLGDPTNIRITKTAMPSWERQVAYDWTLEKSVTPANVSLAPGASANLDYTVTVTRTPVSDVSVYSVSGQICVTNVGGGPTIGLKIWDNVQRSTNGGTTWATIAVDTLDISANPSINGGQTACYNYAIPFTPVPGAIYRNEGKALFTNSSTAPGGIGIWEAYVPFTLPAVATLTEEDESATLADVLTCPAGFTCSAGPGGTTLTGSQTLQYAITVTNTSAPCGHNATIDNTATLTEDDSGTESSDDASVGVDTPVCTTPLSLTKTASTTWNRSIVYDWSITKSVTPTNANLAPNATATLNYTIGVTRSPVSDVSAYNVSGQVCVTNDGTVPTQGLSVVDNVQASTNGGGSWSTIASGNVNVSGAPVLAGGQTHCYSYSYPFTPVAGAIYRNEAVATVSNPPGHPSNTASYDTNTGFTLPASPSNLSETDEAATVSDVLTCPAGFTCSAAPGGWSLTGSQTLTFAVVVTNVSAPCSHSDEVKNTAKVTEGDSGNQSSASATVIVDTPDCAPPSQGIEGCTPGYWKQKQHFGNWVGYIPTGTTASKFNAVFGVNLFSSSTTLLTALGTGGGGKYRLGRHATAALLNSAQSGVDYGMTTAQVIAAVQAAVASGNYDAAADIFEQKNERGCPLGRAD